MKSLFTRFKQPAGSGGTGTPNSPLLDEKDRPESRRGASTLATPAVSDDTVRVSRSTRAQAPARTALPTNTNAESRHSLTPRSTSTTPSTVSDKPLPARPTTPGHGRVFADSVSDHQRDARNGGSVALRNSVLGRKPSSLAASSSSVAGDVDPTLEWALRPQHRMSMDNVKKVMFQSPNRNVHASETDLRAVVAGPSRHQRRTSSPHRPVSPSSTPTQNNVYASHPRVVSRSSSRQSSHVRKPSGSGSHISYSPTKSTMSTLAPSDCSTMSAASYLPIPESWSAAMDEELIANLGPRERTRQEVLWEIVNSEEKYVQDLVNLNETFCKALLPAPELSPSLSLPDPLALTRTISTATTDNGDPRLPIAAQFASSRFSSDSFRDHHLSSAQSSEPQQYDGDAARQSAYDTLTRPKTKETRPAPPSRSGSGTRNRLSFNSGGKRESGHVRKSSVGSINANGPVTLPDDLEQVLTVISSGILEGHIKQVTALRKRYDEQFPLVRSLADVFTSHSDILREYATYIMHLERALAQVDEAMAMADQIATGGRRSSRRLEETQLGRLSKLLVGLEDLAAERGEACLSISLSKPFQRLLKYPLLFQNLLYNTSPSTREYEATVAMVEEVQRIVRSIEDEKSSFEEREKTRDVWARIEGIEKNKQLMAPRPNRLVVSEINLTEKREGVPSAASKERKSQHRLSDMLKKGKKPDQWVVRFTDVSLLCELAGTTTLPMSTTSKPGNAGPKSESVTDLSTKRLSKRHQSLKPRNLYRFIKVYEWYELPARAQAPRIPAVDKFPRRPPLSDLQEGKAVSPNRTPDRTVPLKTGDESPSKLTSLRAGSTFDDAMSDRMSVMSFAFRGEARPNPAVRVRATNTTTTISPKLRSSVTGKTTAASLDRDRRASSGMGSAAAAAKFAHRLRSAEEDLATTTVRPASRARRSLPPAMALGPSERSISRMESPTRPPWNSGSGGGGLSRPASVAAAHPLRPRTSASGVAGATISSIAKVVADDPVGLGIYDTDRSAASASASGASAGASATGGAKVPAGVSAATAARIARRNLGGHI